MGRWIMLWGNFISFFYIFLTFWWFLFHLDFLHLSHLFSSKIYILGQDCQKQFLSASIFTLNLIGIQFEIFGVCWLAILDIFHVMDVKAFLSPGTASWSLSWTFVLIMDLMSSRHFGVWTKYLKNIGKIPSWVGVFRGILGYGPNTSQVLARYHLDYW